MRQLKLAARSKSAQADRDALEQPAVTDAMLAWRFLRILADRAELKEERSIAISVQLARALLQERAA